MKRLEVRRAGSVADLLDWLQLLERVGYVHPEKLPSFESARSQAAGLAPETSILGWPSSTLLAQQEGRYVGTITFTRIADRTWVLHHLAAEKRYASVDVLRALLGEAFAALLAEPTAEILLIHSRSGKRHVGGLVEHLTSRIRGLGRQAFATRRVLFGGPPTETFDRGGGDISVRIIRPSDDSRLAALTTSGNELIDRALSIGGHLTSVDPVTSAYSDHHLPRERKLVVFTSASARAPMACAVADMLPSLLDLSGLLSTVQLFFPRDHEHAAAISRSLISGLVTAFPSVSSRSRLREMRPLSGHEASRPGAAQSDGLVRIYTQLAIDLVQAREDSHLLRSLYRAVGL